MNTNSGLNPAYPGDEIVLEFAPDPNDGITARIGPLYLHYWNDAVHESVSVGTITGLADGPHIFETVIVGR